jgi:hypothetical protein
LARQLEARKVRLADLRKWELFHLSTSVAFNVTAPRDSNEAAAPACFALAHRPCCVGSIAIGTIICPLRPSYAVNMLEMRVPSFHLGAEQQRTSVGIPQNMVATHILKFDKTPGGATEGQESGG